MTIAVTNAVTRLILFSLSSRRSAARLCGTLCIAIFTATPHPFGSTVLAQQAVPLPPSPGAAKPARPQQRPGPAGKAEACENVPALSTPEVVQKVNAYFNGFVYLIGNFQQANSDGRRYKGQIYVQRPGRLRFDYDDPSPLEIVSDGTSVVVRNRKLATQDVYGIGQTPLKFLLKDRLDLNTDTKVIGGSRECDSLVLAIEDRGTITGTARIRLVLNADPVLLKQWTISDANGSETTVNVSNLETGRKPDPKLFVIDLTRIIDPK